MRNRGFWRRQALWYAGRFVESYTGCQVTLDGCRFDVSPPAFNTIGRGTLWWGNYETPERAAIGKFLRPDLPVIEFGASMGVIACVTNKRLAQPSAHLVVEANPALLPILHRQRELNRCEFHIVGAAVAYGTDEVRFSQADSPVAGTVDEHGSVPVATTSLQRSLEALGATRCTLICDIEGAELDLWRHERELITQSVDTLIVETHPGIYGRDAETAFLAELKASGLTGQWQQRSTIVMSRANG